MAEKKKEEEQKPRRRVKKVAGHGGHHGGAWKVAYADFVTAMMALFLVLWLVSQADVKVKQAIANYFRSPGVFTTAKGGILSGPEKVSKAPERLSPKTETEALTGVAEALRKKFDSRPEFTKEKDRIKIDVTEEGLRIQLVDKADKISFPSGSAEMSEDAKEILNEIAQAICELPNRILIGGHTDSKPFGEGSDYTNWELSADRANATRRQLESNCVKPEQIARIVGYADTMPIVPEDPFSPANRRISITVLRSTIEPTVDNTNSKTPDNSKSEQSNSEPAKPTKKVAADDTQPVVKAKVSPEKPKAETEKTPDSEPEKTPAKEADEEVKTETKPVIVEKNSSGNANTMPIKKAEDKSNRP